MSNCHIRHAAAARTRGLFRGGSALTSLGLSACTAASAMQKMKNGSEVSEEDKASLDHIGRLIHDAADSVDFFSTAGNQGNPPAASFAPQINAAIAVAKRQERVGTTELDSIPNPAARLRALSSTIINASPESDSILLDHLYDFFLLLSRSVLRATATSGETTARIGRLQTLSFA